MLQKAVKIEPKFLDAYLSLGGIYGELKEYKNAVDNYEKARSIDSVYFKDYALPYSINLAGLGEFQKALDAVNDFLSISDLNPSGRKAGEYRKQCYSFAIDYAKKKSVTDYKFEPKNLVTASTVMFQNIFQPSRSMAGNYFIHDVLIV